MVYMPRVERAAIIQYYHITIKNKKRFSFLFLLQNNFNVTTFVHVMYISYYLSGIKIRPDSEWLSYHE